MILVKRVLSASTVSLKDPSFGAITLHYRLRDLTGSGPTTVRNIKAKASPPCRSFGRWRRVRRRLKVLNYRRGQVDERRVSGVVAPRFAVDNPPGIKTRRGPIFARLPYREWLVLCDCATEVSPLSCGCSDASACSHKFSISISTSVLVLDRPMLLG